MALQPKLTMAEILAGAKAKATLARESQADQLDKLLHGSGITKKSAEQADRDFTKQNAQQSQLAESQPIINLDVDRLPSTMMAADIQLDEDQLAAVEGIKQQKYSVLIGAAGTGKTTVSKAVIHALQAQVPLIDLNSVRLERERTDTPIMNVAVCLVAFTGKACQQMKRAMPKQYHQLINTIHSTLGYAPVVEEYLDTHTNEWKARRVFRPTFTANNQLPFKVCFIDEAGMVPINLWNELIAALPDDCRVVLVGDINQLPPVQGRSVLGFAMTQWPVYELTKIHRQAADNPIIANAHRILTGKMPLADSKKFAIVDMPDGGMETLVKSCGTVQHLHKLGKFDPMQDAFIVPQNVGTIGQEHINENLVRYFNPLRKIEGVPINPRTVITAGYVHVMMAVGDKVMLLQNNRQLGLTNGMTGVVMSIRQNERFKGDSVADSVIAGLSDGNDPFDLQSMEDDIDEDEREANKVKDDPESERQASHIMSVAFQNVDEPVDFQTAGEFKKVAHAYAATCHKSQGSEYPTVVILAHSSNGRMLNREWLYTAVTRGSERVVLMCNRRGLLKAITNQTIKGNTLAEKVASFNALQDKTDVSIPNLPAPETVELDQANSPQGV